MSADDSRSAATVPLVMDGKSNEGGYGAVYPINMPAGASGPPPAHHQGSYQAPPYPGEAPINHYSTEAGQYQRPSQAPDSHVDAGARAERNSDGNATFFAEEDLYLMTPQVKVQYDEVFKEPDGANSWEVLATINGAIFKWTQLGVYRFFSVILGIILVFVWGIIFALLNFAVVFLLQPTIKMVFVGLRPAGMLIKGLVRTFLDPLWQSVGLVFSRIAGKFALNVRGLMRPAVEVVQQAAISEV